MIRVDRKRQAAGQNGAFDPYETWVKEPTRQHSVVIWDNMYFLDLAANRWVERHWLRRDGRWRSGCRISTMSEASF